jgi:hypothetical protein
MSWRSPLFALLAFAAAGCPVDDRLLAAARLDGNGGTSTTSGDAGQSQSGADGGAGEAGAAGHASSDGGSAGTASNDGGDGALGGPDDGGRSGSAEAGASSSGFEPCREDVNDNGVFDCEENLLQNGTFDSDTSGWEAEVSASADWDSGNAPGAGLGSLAVTNANGGSATSYTMLGARQCVAVSEGAQYQLLARTFLLEGALGSAGLNLYFYAADACAGSPLQVVAGGLSGLTGQWSTVNKDFTSPAGARSMHLRLVVQKKKSDPAVTARFDNVLLRPL